MQEEITTKEVRSLENIEDYIEELLVTVQNDIYKKQKRIETNTLQSRFLRRIQKVLEEKGGFIAAHWDGTAEEEEQIKEETKATIRCIPLDAEEEQGISLITGKTF